MDGIYDLSDTVDMMCSDDWQERFKAEYIQLVLRLERLRAMVSQHRNHLLDFEFTCSVDVLERQIDCMAEYQGILEGRAILEGIDLDL